MSHLEEHRDALLDRRVRVEDSRDFLGLLERIGDVEVRRRAVGVAQRAAGSAAMRVRARARPSGLRVSSTADRVGQVLAPPGHGELHRVGGERREDRQHDRDDQRGSPPPGRRRSCRLRGGGPCRPRSSSGGRSRRSGRSCRRGCRRASRSGCRSCGCATSRGRRRPAAPRGRGGPEPARHRDRRVLGVAAGGECVGRGLVEDVHRRHLRQAGGDRHLLDDVEELRLFCVRRPGGRRSRRAPSCRRRSSR